MPSTAQHPVVVVCEHLLLGEGIARLVWAETGVPATVVRVEDVEAVRAAMLRDPGVVVLECARPPRGVDMTELAPHAVLIDVSAAMDVGPVQPSEAIGVEPILAAVRGRRPDRGAGARRAG